ncbi:Oidioi.mRNA.OKI2018_I69.PAR.g11829.t1.cds [Oikopleura dioica]|uniref:Oidioi.mRNA.OKI2018_I69.PAR.g11829.t1.cds n=1 Tax=Oikopleura dioica TaxID=34765 RepID=A0ABN7S375_OIKDI|nr:Oidioi.mRNA.OKI2018_I69.PAR.g11829.t1.cds [Oikopleura dioica]
MSGNGNLKKGTNRKRKNKDGKDDQRTKRSKNSDLPPSDRLPKHGFPSDHPYNKDGYRYCLAEPDPHIPDNDPDEEHARPVAIPPKVYRKLEHPIPLLSSHDRAQQLNIDDDRLTVTGERGYSTVRGTHSVRKGKWYFEVLIKELPDDSAVRVGWSQKYASIQNPVGCDVFGYSIRSKKGTVFHQARGKSYTNKVGFEEGDVIGCEISLSPNAPSAYKLPDTLKEATLIKFKNFYYFESRDQMKNAKENLKEVENSSVTFYRNGKSLGTAFKNIYDGEYFPAISLYKDAKVTVNFGGTPWKHRPEATEKEKAAEPIEKRGFSSQIEQAMADLLFAVDLKINGILKTDLGKKLDSNY